VTGDGVLVPARDGRGDFEDRGSRFLGSVFRMPDEAAFVAALAGARAKHPKARHHCWAWRLESTHRFHDDGEPGGTAGRPMLQVLDSAGLVQAGVIVVRYFGGVKLGTGGLVRAYTAATQRALLDAGTLFLEARERWRVRLPFERLGLRAELEALCGGLVWTEAAFDEAGWTGTAELPVSASATLAELLVEHGGGAVSWEKAAS